MKEIKHGFLGKYFTYKKVGFKEVPPTTEERRQDIINKMKPWVYDPDVIKVKFAFIAGADEPEPSPTPTPSQTALPTPTPSITPTPSATPGPSIPMTDLITWYDTSDTSTITEVGGQVSQLNDKSGNGFNLTQGTSSYQPLTFSDAVGAGIIFDGSDDRLSNTTMTGYSSVTGLTKFFVFTKSATTANEEMIVQIGSTGRLHYYYQDYAGEEQFKSFDYPGPYFSPLLSWSKAPNFLNWTYMTKPSPYNYDAELNDITYTSTAADNWGPQDFNKISIGARDNGGNPSSFVLREILIYENELSTININAVETYLKNKWNYSAW